jgi:hypothetical protein
VGIAPIVDEGWIELAQMLTRSGRGSQDYFASSGCLLQNTPDFVRRTARH